MKEGESNKKTGKTPKKKPEENEVPKKIFFYNHPSINKFTLDEPQKIIKKLNYYFPGNESAKENIIFAIQQNWLRSKYPDSEIPKENIFLYGNTGAGKYSFVKTLGKIINVPVVRINLESLLITNKTVEEHLADYIFEGTQNQENPSKPSPTAVILAAKNGEKLEDYDEIFQYKPHADFSIIYLENANFIMMNTEKKEIDALLYTNLLTLQTKLADSINFPFTLNIQNFNTSNMLYVLSGKLEEHNSSVGFQSPEIAKNKKSITRAELVESGYSQGLAKCFTRIVNIKDLSVEEIKQILYSKASSLHKSSEILKKEYDITVERLDEKVVSVFAEHIYKRGDNFTGLRDAVNKLLSPYYMSPLKYKGKTVKITEEQINKLKFI